MVTIPPAFSRSFQSISKWFSIIGVTCIVRHSTRWFNAVVHDEDNLQNLLKVASSMKPNGLCLFLPLSSSFLSFLPSLLHRSFLAFIVPKSIDFSLHQRSLILLSSCSSFKILLPSVTQKLDTTEFSTVGSYKVKQEGFALSEITNYVLSVWVCAAAGRSSEAGTLSLYCGRDNEESTSNSFWHKRRQERENPQSHWSSVPPSCESRMTLMFPACYSWVEEKLRVSKILRIPKKIPNSPQSTIHSSKKNIKKEK